MKSYACEKCGSVDVFVDDRGNQKALVCGDCGSWLKWIGKKELPLVKRFIESNKVSVTENIKEDDVKSYTVRIPFTGAVEMTVDASDKKKAIEIVQENARLNDAVEWNLEDNGIEVYKD